MRSSILVKPLRAAALAALLSAACGGSPDGAGGAPQLPGESTAGDDQVPADHAAPPARPAGPVYDAVPLIPREVLFGNPSKVAPQLSPDGKRLGYLAPQDGVLNVWVKTVGKDDDRMVTADKVRGIRQYFWSPNGKQIVYLQDSGGDENWHAYAVPAGGGEALDLTPIKGVQAEIVSVERKVPGAILVGLNDRDPQYHDVYRVDLASGKRTLVLENDMKATGFVADHKLRLRVVQILLPEGGAKLMHRASDKGAWKELTRWGAEDDFTTSPSGFAGDDRTLYMNTSVGSNAVELRALDTGTAKMKVLASDPAWDVTTILEDPVSHAVLAAGFYKDRLEWKPLDKKVEADLAALAKLGDGDISIASMDEKNRTWLVELDDDDHGPRYYAWDRASKKESFLFAARPELEDFQLAEMKAITYKSRDGLTIHAYLTLPAKVDAKKLPLVMHPHGGPWARDNWGYNALPQFLANRGYAVLQPNFRGSTGYGKEFLNAANKEWGGKMQEDLTDGTKWLVDQGIADPDRMCILGGSYGGYATLMGLAKDPDLYACGVDIVGVANLITWMKTIPPYWMPYLDQLRQRVGDTEKDEAFLKSRSPVFLVDKIKAPLLIGQGKNDPRVPRAESIQIRDALKKAGKTVEYIEFADEGHGFARPENRLVFFGMAEGFLARYLGGRAEPPK